VLVSPSAQPLRILVYLALGLPLLAVILHTVLRIARYFHKFAMPQFMADAVDNPLRRRLQPPDETPARHGIQPGMRVLEIGPGKGTYTLATARRVGESGRVTTIDIEPKMIERVERRAREEGIQNIEARVADEYELPFEDGLFDAIYMIAVIGEIPEPERALNEFHRVLSLHGTLAFSELLSDADYPRRSTLSRLAASAGFSLKKKVGNFFYYTVVFEK
jgi:ubiquinone/menaquinone biosynthesis C-methylase UbiE